VTIRLPFPSVEGVPEGRGGSVTYSLCTTIPDFEGVILTPRTPIAESALSLSLNS
jgi:hypothetical protein